MVKTYKNTFYRETDCIISYCALSGPVQRIGKYVILF